jgi:hypothetical protein
VTAAVKQPRASRPVYIRPCLVVPIRLLRLRVRVFHPACAEDAGFAPCAPS